MHCVIMPELIKKSIFEVSHPRSGTHLLINLLRKNFTDFSSWKLSFLSTSALFFTEKQLRDTKTGNRSRHFIGSRYQRPIIKSHVMARHVNWRSYEHSFEFGTKKPILYIYRNPIHVFYLSTPMI